MAFRGRGRGRGGYGRAYAKPVPFELFPEIPALGKATDVKENRFMAVWFSKFEKFCQSSAYYLEDADKHVKKNQGTEIERFSTRGSEKIRSKAQLSDFINTGPGCFPVELFKGDRKEKRITDDKEKRGIKKVKWDAGSDVEDLLSKKFLEYEGENANEKKKGEDEEDDEVGEESSSSEEEDDDDYTKNIDFDDDEDDFNMGDDNDDEPIY